MGIEIDPVQRLRFLTRLTTQEATVVQQQINHLYRFIETVSSVPNEGVAYSVDQIIDESYVLIDLIHTWIDFEKDLGRERRNAARALERGSTSPENR